MTSSEFRSARKTLRLTQEALGAELGLTPHVIAGMENGEAKVPKAIKREMEYRVAVAKTDALLKASGLPECPVADDLLKRTAEEMGNDERLKLTNAVIAHFESCATCKARSEYARKHGPPMPEMPSPFWIRALGFIEGLLEKLPAPLRPPKGDRGEGRRVAVWAAAFFSAVLIGYALIVAFARLATGGQSSSWWRESAGVIATMPIAIFIGFFLAATVYDLTRPIASRFAGYVLRGGLIPVAVYGTVGLALPFVTKEIRFAEWPWIVIGLSVFSALLAAVMWLIDRLRGRLSTQTR